MRINLNTGITKPLGSGYTLFLVLGVLITVGFADHYEKYPQNYFEEPVPRQILLSGTFGELRSNHFHAGLDIKSRDGSVGEPLRVAGPGYISRVAVKSGGYGNAVYVDHPNGYTSVYAHLHRFTEEVAEYVKSMQYAQQQFEVNLSPPAGKFHLSKGDIVGYLGNSGSSSGPHLHFEIRKTASQLPVNPLLFGIDVRDNQEPSIRTLRVYGLDESLNALSVSEVTPIALGDGKYAIRDTIVIRAERAGFGLKAYDRMDGASNLNGIYGLSMQVDDMPQYNFTLDEIAFSQSRYLNAHIDYAARQNGKGYYHKCFKLPGNALNIYSEENEKGIINLSDTTTRKIIIRSVDQAGNHSELSLHIRGEQATSQTKISGYKRISYPESNQIHKDEVELRFEPHTFYQNFELEYSVDTVIRRGMFAPLHSIGSEDIPVHRYFDITLLGSGIPFQHLSKAFIGQMDSRGRLVSWGGVADGDRIYSRVRSLGKFTIGIDTVPPEIIPLTFRSNMRGMSRMRFRIGDTQSVTGQADDLQYEARVDGEWILMEYDGKRSTLTHWFDGRITAGDHELVLRVSDDRGNETLLKRNFTL